MAHGAAQSKNQSRFISWRTGFEQVHEVHEQIFIHTLPRLDLWPYYQALSENRLPPKNPMSSDQFNCNSVAKILVVNGKSPLFKTKP